MSANAAPRDPAATRRSGRVRPSAISAPAIPRRRRRRSRREECHKFAAPRISDAGPAAAAAPNRRWRKERRRARASMSRRRQSLLTAWRTPARTALTRRSAGRLSAALRGFRHQNRAATITALLAAKIQNGTAIPAAAMTRPPSAGPAARPTLKPTPFRAVALSRSSLGTRSGMVAAPGGRGQRSAHAEQEGRRQQERRRGEAQRHQAGENHGNRQNREFDRNQQPPGIDDVRQARRPAG